MPILMLIIGIMISAHDGDTATVVEANGTKHTVRILSIDSPEVYSPKCKPQPFGREAGNYINSILKGKEVEVYITGKDVYGRELGHIYYNDEDISPEMIKAGYAEVYRGKTDFMENPYYVYEQRARNERRGMWTQIDSGVYESPRVYRQRCY